MNKINVYRVELLIVDDDKIGAEEIRDVIENVAYPNHCMAPSVMSIAKRTVEWSDDHPLNHRDTQQAEFERLFKLPEELGEDEKLVQTQT